MDRTTAEGKARCAEFSDALRAAHSRIACCARNGRRASPPNLRVDEPVLREALRRAAAERRSEVKPKRELLAPVVKPAERRLIQMLVDPAGFRESIAQEIANAGLHRGLETERIFDSLVAHAGQPVDPNTIAASLSDRDRQLVFEIVFENSSESVWDEAESCLNVLRARRVEQELSELQKQIEAKPAAEELARLLKRRIELQRHLSVQKTATTRA